MVADIAKLSVGREEYYTRELATDHEAYLSGHGESPGRWYGAGATTLGLEGAVELVQAGPLKLGRIANVVEEGCGHQVVPIFRVEDRSHIAGALANGSDMLPSITQW